MIRDPLNSISERIIINRFTEKIRLGSLGLDIGNDRWMASLQLGLRHDTFIIFFEYSSTIRQMYDLKCVIWPCLVVFLYTGILLVGVRGKILDWTILTHRIASEIRQCLKKKNMNRECPTRLQPEGWGFVTFMHFKYILYFITTHILHRTFTSIEPILHKWAGKCQKALYCCSINTIAFYYLATTYISFRKCKSRIHTSKHFQEITLFSTIWTESAKVYNRIYKITLNGMSEFTKTTKKKNRNGN